MIWPDAAWVVKAVREDHERSRALDAENEAKMWEKWEAEAAAARAKREKARDSKREQCGRVPWGIQVALPGDPEPAWMGGDE